MPKFQLNKLVRDKIVDDQISLGQKPEYHKLNREDHQRELLRKIIEEATELQRAKPADAIGELADIKQAFEDLIAVSGCSKEEIEEIQRAKAEKSGGFLKGVYISTLETSEEDPWNAYYRQEPERFPEI